MVYILSKEGKPLMPTSRHGKVKHLLKSNRAKVVKRTPFVIQLLYDTTEKEVMLFICKFSREKITGKFTKLTSLKAVKRS